MLDDDSDICNRDWSWGGNWSIYTCVNTLRVVMKLVTERIELKSFHDTAKGYGIALSAYPTESDVGIALQEFFDKKLGAILYRHIWYTDFVEYDPIILCQRIKEKFGYDVPLGDYKVGIEITYQIPEEVVDPKSIYDTFTCPGCSGTKTQSDFFDGTKSDCVVCQGSGFVSLAYLMDRIA